MQFIASSLSLYDYCHLNYFSIVLCAGRFHGKFNYAEQLNNHSLMNKIYIYLQNHAMPSGSGVRRSRYVWKCFYLVKNVKRVKIWKTVTWTFTWTCGNTVYFHYIFFWCTTFCRICFLVMKFVPNKLTIISQ